MSGIPLFKAMMYALFGKVNRESAYEDGYNYACNELEHALGKQIRARADQLMREAHANAKQSSPMSKARAEGMYAALSEYRKNNH